MENHKKSPSLSLETKDIVIVKPSMPTPSEILSLSTIDNDPNINILCQTIYVYKPNLDFPNDKKDPACVIKEALSKALVYYYPLAGKITTLDDGKLGINCNGDGVPFLESNANCELSSLHYLEGIDVPTAQKLVFDNPSQDQTSPHPLVFKVTKFLCGGFTIGMGLSHSVCDGYGASQFYRALAELASGKNEPSLKPVWERERLTAKSTLKEQPFQFLIDKTSIATSPFLPTKEISHECFNLNGDTIKRLKMKLMKESDDGKHVIKENFTTLETLGAYVWKSKVKALKLNNDGKTMFCLAVGVRKLLDPPLHEGYYGNAFVASNVVLKVKELNEKPLFEIVKLIKESKKLPLNNEYIKNSINILETMRKRNIRIEGTGASLVLTDWRQLGLLQEVDFGWKDSVNIVPVPWNMFGFVDLCLFLPPNNLDPSMKGGVRIFVSLPKASMAKFKEEMEFLKVMKVDEDSS
ncbi:putative taxadien-5-alpha-ol O-acetyltransferase [Medicago truncatula]|uniref:HXXXD-type acyl-transferase family protein n=1 Tax=Medicago truncatula TaxID=3880 RepID=G7JKY1_MEDTR|nr:spermidine coumaroyl-CoA acyltransferase [Medicago truncatula]AES88441.1 HXXXD-type acyl-transferase family protein [Medicago truncatula]RHN60554.1 putative taxadien-5-alpha-ol O-acetyltransferase [Medicago truncatula]